MPLPFKGRPTLSKSDFKAGRECPVKVWYRKRRYPKSTDRDPFVEHLAEGGHLVGKVAQVGEDSSVVILLSDEVCQVSARVMGTTEQGILSGQRGALNAAPELKLRYVSKDAAISPGDVVISSGVGGVFPENLLLGQVKEFSRGPIAGEAAVTSKVDFAVLKNVFVVSGLKE